MYTSSSIYGDGYYHHHQPPPPSYVDIFPDSGPPGKVPIFWEGHKIFSNFVAFSEYPNFNIPWEHLNITSAKGAGWVGKTRQFLLTFSIIYADVGLVDQK